MIRWLRVTAVGVLFLTMIGLGVVVGLFLVANSGWVAVRVPPWLTGLFGDPNLELWLPALIAGWLVSIIGLTALILWSMYYVWRRRQYESLIAGLERELVRLRNLPFTDPAPLEDLPEAPDARAAAVLAAASGDDDGDEGAVGGY